MILKAIYSVTSTFLIIFFFLCPGTIENLFLLAVRHDPACWKNHYSFAGPLKNYLLFASLDLCTPLPSIPCGEREQSEKVHDKK